MSIAYTYMYLAYTYMYFEDTFYGIRPILLTVFSLLFNSYCFLKNIYLVKDLKCTYTTGAYEPGSKGVCTPTPILVVAKCNKQLNL